MISPPFKIHFISCDRSFYVPQEKEYGKFKNSKLYLFFWRHWISWICPSFLYLLVPFFSSIRKINSLFELIAWKRSLPTHHLGRKKKEKTKRRKKEEEVALSPSRQEKIKKIKEEKRKEEKKKRRLPSPHLGRIRYTFHHLGRIDLWMFSSWKPCCHNLCI